LPAPDCNALQHATTNYATHCNILYDALCKTLCNTFCNTLCNNLQHSVTFCNTLQHAATRCNMLQHIASACLFAPLPHLFLFTLWTHCITLQDTARHCNALQHTAKHHLRLFSPWNYCNTLQHAAAHCNTLQHTATHCSTLDPLSACALPALTPLFSLYVYMCFVSGLEGGFWCSEPEEGENQFHPPPPTLPDSFRVYFRYARERGRERETEWLRDKDKDTHTLSICVCPPPRLLQLAPSQSPFSLQAPLRSN